MNDFHFKANKDTKMFTGNRENLQVCATPTIKLNCG